MIEEQMQKTIQYTCEGAGAKATFQYRKGYDAVYNHPEQTKKVEQLAKLIVGEDQVKHQAPTMGGEDFAYYLQKVPGTFFFVGGGNPEIKADHPHHHPLFDVDERSMLITGKIFLSVVLNELTEGTDVPNTVTYLNTSA
jgi:amidohydrolase